MELSKTSSSIDCPPAPMCSQSEINELPEFPLDPNSTFQQKLKIKPPVAIKNYLSTIKTTVDPTKLCKVIMVPSCTSSPVKSEPVLVEEPVPKPFRFVAVSDNKVIPSSVKVKTVPDNETVSNCESNTIGDPINKTVTVNECNIKDSAVATETIVSECTPDDLYFSSAAPKNKYCCNCNEFIKPRDDISSLSAKIPRSRNVGKRVYFALEQMLQIEGHQDILVPPHMKRQGDERYLCKLCHRFLRMFNEGYEKMHRNLQDFFKQTKEGTYVSCKKESTEPLLPGESVPKKRVKVGDESQEKLPNVVYIGRKSYSHEMIIDNVDNVTQEVVETGFKSVVEDVAQDSEVTTSQLETQEIEVTTSQLETQESEETTLELEETLEENTMQTAEEGKINYYPPNCELRTSGTTQEVCDLQVVVQPKWCRKTYSRAQPVRAEPSKEILLPVTKVVETELDFHDISAPMACDVPLIQEVPQPCKITGLGRANISTLLKEIYSNQKQRIILHNFVRRKIFEEQQLFTQMTSLNCDKPVSLDNINWRKVEGELREIAPFSLEVLRGLSKTKASDDSFTPTQGCVIAILTYAKNKKINKMQAAVANLLKNTNIKKVYCGLNRLGICLSYSRTVDRLHMLKYKNSQQDQEMDCS